MKDAALDATEFEQRSQAIFSRMDKSLAKIEQRARVPVSIHTRDRMVFPVDLSLRVCLPLLASVVAWHVTPGATLPVMGLAAVGMEYARSARISVSHRITNLMIKAIGRNVAATVLEMAYANSQARMSDTPAPIIRAAKRYLDPDKARMITPGALDTPTADHATIIERALHDYGLLTSGRAHEALVIDELERSGLLDEARALISREGLSAGVAPSSDQVPPIECQPQANPAPRRF